MVAGLDGNKNNFFNGGHVLIDRQQNIKKLFDKSTVRTKQYICVHYLKYISKHEIKKNNLLLLGEGFLQLN